jgi:two-component system OmpR family sensor kinase
VIRRRLTAMVVALVAVLGGLAVVFAVRTLEARLIDDIDQELESVPPNLDRESGEELRRQLAPGLEDARRVAVVRIGPGGAIVSTLPSGPEGDPDPLPDVSGLAAPRGPFTLDGQEGGPRYRAVTSTLPRGGVLMTAISLEDVDAAVADARQVLAGAGLVALAVIAVAAWLAIRLGLRPLDRMVDTATRIAEGHITERVPVRSHDSEVGRLGTALNRMLDRIGDALDAWIASEQRMRQFVSDASHELRTPLTAIRGYAELSGRSDDPAQREEAMARVEQAAVRMAALVDDLVLLARLDQGRPLARDPVDLSDVVMDAVADARAVEPGRDIDVIAPVVGTTVVGDRARLRQVVDNLLANVREHTPSPTRVAVTVVGRSDGVMLSVRDDGPGMSREEASRAFDRFWQAPASEAHPQRGTGLGLAIVADIVSAHGGTIDLETSPGQGVGITIWLPPELPEGAMLDSQVSPSEP